jgi:hypothetical protein
LNPFMVLGLAPCNYLFTFIPLCNGFDPTFIGLLIEVPILS